MMETVRPTSRYHGKFSSCDKSKPSISENCVLSNEMKSLSFTESTSSSNNKDKGNNIDTSPFDMFRGSGEENRIQVTQEINTRVEKFRSKSSLFKKSQHTKNIQQLRWSHIDVGMILGRGNFAAVHQVNAICWPKEYSIMSQHDNKRYALKMLREDLFVDQNEYLVGAVDLVFEAQLLSNLQHENIIQLYGEREGEINHSFRDGAYFIIVDYLVITLDKKLKEWHTEQKLSSLSWATQQVSLDSLMPFGNQEMNKALINRLKRAAIGLAQGMEYLHSKNILYRDLKPQNVGFDCYGTVRIFDFGLAHELADCNQLISSGPIGSTRYMSNEVANCEDYGLSADVYSYGVLLWEICTLERPYKNISSVKQHTKKVVLGNERPSLRKSCFSSLDDPGLVRLLDNSWNKDRTKRPDFKCVRNTLQKILNGQEKKFESNGTIPSDVSKPWPPARPRNRLFRRAQSMPESDIASTSVGDSTAFEGKNRRLRFGLSLSRHSSWKMKLSSSRVNAEEVQVQGDKKCNGSQQCYS